MSKKRQAEAPDEPELLVRSYAVTHPANVGLPERVYASWDQLAYASRGVMTVRTGGGSWVVPPHRAVWIPAGTPHSVELAGRVSLRTLYVRRGLAGGLGLGGCRALDVAPLLRELVLHISRLNTLRGDRPAHVRLLGVLLDQLALSCAEPLQLPMPHDPRARRLAEALLAEPGAADVLADGLRRAGASRRTVERLFVAETQMTLGQWVRRARLIASLRLLAGGRSVTTAALEVGYSSPSAFIAAFRLELGVTPGRFFGGG